MEQMAPGAKDCGATEQELSVFANQIVAARKLPSTQRFQAIYRGAVKALGQARALEIYPTLRPYIRKAVNGG